MGSIAENKHVVASFYTALAAKDVETVSSLLADDLVCWVAGTTPASGSCGRERFLELFAMMREAIDGQMTLIFDAVTAEEDRVALLARGSMRTTSGKDYNNFYHFFTRVRDGQIVEMREYLDTELLRSIIE